MTKIAILGAGGRMGQALVRCSAGIESVRIVAAIEQAGNPAVGKDAGDVAGTKRTGIVITGDVESVEKADVVIDFTLGTAVPGNARTAVRHGIAMVIGTTGLTDLDAGEIRQASQKIPIVWAPNMSLGVNLLFALVKKSASVLGKEYRIEIEETHHVHKKDAPSGTALKIGEKIAEGLRVDFRQNMVHAEGDGDFPDGDRLIKIRSRREGAVVGDHTASFENQAERIELTHRARSRDAFAIGALHAACWVHGRQPGMYDMQDVLGL